MICDHVCVTSLAQDRLKESVMDPYIARILVIEIYLKSRFPNLCCTSLPSLRTTPIIVKNLSLVATQPLIMPLWKIYHSADAFTTQEEKDAVARGATEFYVSKGLPSFYVHVIFFPIATENKFTGGTPQSRFVIIELAHIARNWDGDQKRATVIKDSVDRVMRPFTIDKGIHLEYAVLEGPAALWRIDGIDPPEAFGPDEQEQAEANRKILHDKYGA